MLYVNESVHTENLRWGDTLVGCTIKYGSIHDDLPFIIALDCTLSAENIQSRGEFEVEDGHFIGTVHVVNRTDGKPQTFTSKWEFDGVTGHPTLVSGEHIGIYLGSSFGLISIIGSGTIKTNYSVVIDRITIDSDCIDPSYVYGTIKDGIHVEKGWVYVIRNHDTPETFSCGDSGHMHIRGTSPSPDQVLTPKTINIQKKPY